MASIMEDYARITIRLKPHERQNFGHLMEIVRSRAGYDVPATDVIKNLMGFKTKLAPLSEDDRAVLKKETVRKLTRA